MIKILILILQICSLFCLSHPLRNTIGYKIENKNSRVRNLLIRKISVRILSFHQKMEVGSDSMENLEKCFEAAIVNSGKYSNIIFESESDSLINDQAELSFYVEDAWKFSYYKNPSYLTGIFFLPFNEKEGEAQLFWPGIIPATYPYSTMLPFLPKAGKVSLSLNLTIYRNGIIMEEINISDALEYQTFFWGIYRITDAEFTSTLLYPRVFDRLTYELKKMNME